MPGVVVQGELLIQTTLLWSRGRVALAPELGWFFFITTSTIHPMIREL